MPEFNDVSVVQKYHQNLPGVDQKSSFQLPLG